MRLSVGLKKSAHNLYKTEEKTQSSKNDSVIYSKMFSH